MAASPEPVRFVRVDEIDAIFTPLSCCGAAKSGMGITLPAIVSNKPSTGPGSKCHSISWDLIRGIRKPPRPFSTKETEAATAGA